MTFKASTAADYAFAALSSDISVIQERHFSMTDVPPVQVAAVKIAAFALEEARRANGAGEAAVAAALIEQGNAALWLCQQR